jgi:hypothetical protein
MVKAGAASPDLLAEDVAGRRRVGIVVQGDRGEDYVDLHGHALLSS